jgi:hypothetical protein
VRIKHSSNGLRAYARGCNTIASRVWVDSEPGPRCSALTCKGSQNEEADLSGYVAICPQFRVKIPDVSSSR